MFHGTSCMTNQPKYTTLFDLHFFRKSFILFLLSIFISLSIQANPYFTDKNLNITSFAGNVEGCEIKLSWATTHEIGNAYFEVERSFDGQRFFPIGKVNGSGNSIKPSSYYYQDDNIFKENYYYRLKAVDFNGDFIYSEIIKITTGCKREGISIDKIAPTKRNWMKVHVFTDVDLEKAQVLIVDMSDNELIRMLTEIKPGMNLILIDSAGLEPDNYQVKIRYEKKIITTKEFKHITL